MSELKIFEIRCEKIGMSNLPAHKKAPDLLTEFERIHPSSHNVN